MKLNCMNDSWFTIFMIMMRECYYMYKQLCIKIKGANNLAICVLDFQINWRATCSQKLITGCRYLTSYSQKNASNTVNINGDILHIWIGCSTQYYEITICTSTMYQYVQITKWKFCPKQKFLSHQKEVRSLCYTLGIASVST